jgi:hypothetical protein
MMTLLTKGLLAFDSAFGFNVMYTVIRGIIIIIEVHGVECFFGSYQLLCQSRNYLLWNLKVHCHVHKSLPLILTLSHMNRVHNVQPYFFKIYFNIILPSMLRHPR